MTQNAVDSVKESDIPNLVEVWEASVRATHHFLTDADIAVFRPLVRDHLFGFLNMACVRDADGKIAAFIGVAQHKIEALFVQPKFFGLGIGRQLVKYAIDQWQVTDVDVNEQNDQAVGFYQKLGFQVCGRSETDGLGKPFPLLHLSLSPQ